MTSEKSSEVTEKPEDADDITVEAAEPAMGAEASAGDEPALENEPTPEAPERDAVPAQPSRRGAGASFLALLAGGVAAGVVGFALGRIDQTSGWIFGAKEDLGPQNAQSINALSAQISDLESKLRAAGATIDDQTAKTDALTDRVAVADDALARTNEFAASLGALDQRLQDLENRPIPDIGATQEAVAAYEDQLAAMRAMLADELARIEAVQAKALAQQSTLQSETRSAAFQAATARLAAQAESGADMREALQVLRDLNTAIPPVLETHAAGVASQSSLTARFPDVARSTLDRAIELQAEAGEITGLQAFVQKQLGARSLAPREGDDADAVLARAEAELGAGNLQAAVAQANMLRTLEVPALNTWLADATTHIAVQQAIAALEPNSAE